MEEEKYFVLSDTDEPNQIVFSMEEATSKGANYIDSFDKEGKKVKAYMYDSESTDYITNF